MTFIYRNGWALFYSPDDGGYYWQSERGWGDDTSPVYSTKAIAMEAMRNREFPR